MFFTSLVRYDVLTSKFMFMSIKLKNLFSYISQYFTMFRPLRTHFWTNVFLFGLLFEAILACNKKDKPPDRPAVFHKIPMDDEIESDPRKHLQVIFSLYNIQGEF